MALGINKEFARQRLEELWEIERRQKEEEKKTNEQWMRQHSVIASQITLKIENRTGLNDIEAVNIISKSIAEKLKPAEKKTVLGVFLNKNAVVEQMPCKTENEFAFTIRRNKAIKDLRDEVLNVLEYFNRPADGITLYYFHEKRFTVEIFGVDNLRGMETTTVRHYEELFLGGGRDSNWGISKECSEWKYFEI